MKIYAAFSENGSPRGFYPDFAFPDEVNEAGEVTSRHPSVPASAIEITEDQWKLLAGNPAGWRFQGGEVVSYTPPPSVPTQISRAQGKIQLKRAGIWPKVLELASHDTSGEIDVWINDATYWSRSSQFVAQMASALNLSEEKVDYLFVEAAKINAE
jgi:hypothetical protein